MKFFTLVALVAVVSAKPVLQKKFEIENMMTLEEQEQHQKEIQMANIEAHRNERQRTKNAYHQSTRGQRHANTHEVNQFDGLIHLANGERRFPDGTVVDGVGEY